MIVSKVISKHNKGIKISTIATYFKLSYHCVYQIIQRSRSSNLKKIGKKIGRPEKLSDRQKRQIVRDIQKNRRLKYKILLVKWIN